jgi:hypothetical protein
MDLVMKFFQLEGESILIGRERLEKGLSPGAWPRCLASASGGCELRNWSSPVKFQGARGVTADRQLLKFVHVGQGVPGVSRKVSRKEG